MRTGVAEFDILGDSVEMQICVRDFADARLYDKQHVCRVGWFFRDA